MTARRRIGSGLPVRTTLKVVHLDHYDRPSVLAAFGMSGPSVDHDGPSRRNIDPVACDIDPGVP